MTTMEIALFMGPSLPFIITEGPPCGKRILPPAVTS
jgi:hypothetical protein